MSPCRVGAINLNGLIRIFNSISKHSQHAFRDSQMNDEKSARLLSEIEKIISSVEDEYFINNKIIFESEAIRATAHFENIKKAVKSWSRARVCMVPSCASLSIARSHAIPRSMSLMAIADSGNLLTPAFDHKVGSLKMQKVGLSAATTFPGFCTAHEKLFEHFEKDKNIREIRHVLLQAYRTGCRELFRCDSVLKHLNETLAGYVNHRDQGLLRIITERAKNIGAKVKLQASTLTMNKDPLLINAEEKIKTLVKLQSEIKLHLIPAFERAVFNGDSTGIALEALQLDIEFPVALTGIGNFAFGGDERKSEVSALIGVVPQAGMTTLFLASTAANKEHLKNYLSYWCRHALGFLSMVESWMVNGTDQWFITPRVWAALSAERQTSILKKILLSEQNIGQDCQVSIFDELRKQIIRDTKAANIGATNSDGLAYLSNEIKKLF